MEKIQFGVIPPQGWRLDLPSKARSGTSYGTIRNWARRAEDLGYDSLWLYDHLHTVPVPRDAPCFESWMTLSALARETSRIKLGHIVTCNSYRSPSIVAKMGSTLDAASGGRFLLGIGAGWYKEEYEAYGMVFPKHEARSRALEESLEIIRGLWTQDRYSGKGTSDNDLMNAICAPKPVQKPHPPIIVGGESERVLRVAARHATYCNLLSDLPDYSRKIPLIEKVCGTEGRDPSTLFKSLTSTVNVYYGQKAHLTSYKRYLRYLIEMARDPLSSLRFVKLHSQMLSGSSTISGSPKDCLDAIRGYIDLGVTYFILYFLDAPNMRGLETWSKEVLGNV